MNFKVDIGSYRLYLALTRYSKIKGVNSTTRDGRHILLWDFDNISFPTIAQSLLSIQKEWGLSNIYILNTGLPKHYHAYCFTAVDYATMLHILAETKGIDRAYLSIGVLRGYYTLRYQDKVNRPFKAVMVLRSTIKEDINPMDLTGVKYFTKRR